MKFDISIVISSYNRNDKVLQTVQQLFESNFSSFAKVELIIIDDGSPYPVDKLLQQIRHIPDKIEWRLITQYNAGIGATRNRGFREAQASIVIFLDDDILVHKDTVSQLFRAQKQGPGPVIFGNYPFISHSSGSLKKFAEQLYGYDTITVSEKFEKVDAITSGLLSVNKEKLHDSKNLYKDNLSVPAAEEYEIIARFHKQKVPIFMACHIHATHNHHLKLAWLAEQQYKYGLGTAEAFLKYPRITEMEKYAGLKKKMDAGESNFFKNLAATATGRKILFICARLSEKMFPRGNHNYIFGILSAAYYRAGYRDGMRKFS
ncbi:MAG: glycosyltransferase family 2 protein [Bacteroidota bacterium]